MGKDGKVDAVLSEQNTISESSDEARELFNKSRFGEQLEDGRVQLSLIETLYLIEAKKLTLKGPTGKELSAESLVKKAKKLQPNFTLRYVVYKDLRNRGYIVKTALKFGADFRVYDRGVKPGEDHAKWVVFPVHETQTMTWYEFSAKNRVAHSTKKKLLLAIVDDENDVTYYTVHWTRP